MQINYDKAASLQAIQEASELVGLDPEWQERLERRLEIRKSEQQPTPW